MLNEKQIILYNLIPNKRASLLIVTKPFFASSPWILVTNYILEWMGLNFCDYDGLQPKITPPKHFSRQLTIHRLKSILAFAWFQHYKIASINQFNTPKFLQANVLRLILQFCSPVGCFSRLLVSLIPSKAVHTGVDSYRVRHGKLFFLITSGW